MVQDVYNGPRAGYAHAQPREDFSSRETWQHPEPHLTRAAAKPPAQPEHLAGRSAADPDLDRLFRPGNVHFEQQSKAAMPPSGAGFSNEYPGGYPGGYAPHQPHHSPQGQSYVYHTDDFADDLTAGNAGAARPQLGAAQWGGALVSLVLILGLGVWGYKLMVRDVSGVPVIRALEGSARILPDEPGGQLAMHQGLAVNSVTADGSAAPPAERYILAPAPASLSAEDQPMKPVEPVLSAPTMQGSALASANTGANTGADGDTDAETSAETDGLEQIVLGEDPLELNSVAEVAAPVPGPAVMASPIPHARPVRLAALAPRADAPADSAALSGASLDGVAGDILAALGAEGETSAASVPAGTRLVQFGAYQSVNMARSEWDRLSSRYPELMKDKTRVIEQAASGGKSFYRLRAVGFADASDANRFCAALTAMNAACVPTVQR